MEPFYGGNSLLIVQQADTTHLQPGMIAVYRDAAGDLVGHQVLRTGEKIEAKGANNAVVDPSPITDANLVGIVVGMMHASGTAANDLQVVNGKRY
ncbi:MAG: hypothetical protein E1N59_2769 [Puniceicoccaceae bacterium 5H]|nr:MAG: hypothetical protein E1N59_2769 [Puniceicoccaceae bacterium 5H]